MTASLTSAAQQGTATQPPKQKKARSKSVFYVLEDIRSDERKEGTVYDAEFKHVATTGTIKQARSSVDEINRDTKYLIVCVREQGRTKVETITKRIVGK